MRHIVICGLSGSVLLRYLINGTIWGGGWGGGRVNERKMCVVIFCITFVWNVSPSKKNWERYGQKCVPVLM